MLRLVYDNHFSLDNTSSFLLVSSLFAHEVSFILPETIDFDRKFLKFYL